MGLAFPILFLHQAMLQTWLLRCQPVRTSRSPTCLRREVAWEGRLSSMEGKEAGAFGAGRLRRGGDGTQGVRLMRSSEGRRQEEPSRKQTDRQPRQEAAGRRRAQAPRLAEARGRRPSQDGLAPRTENSLFIHTQIPLLPGHKSRTGSEQNLPQEAGQSTRDCPPAPGPSHGGGGCVRPPRGPCHLRAVSMPSCPNATQAPGRYRDLEPSQLRCQ